MVKRTKKLLSMLTAAAMAASTFAGLAIQVGAATPIEGASFDFENNVAFDASGSHTAQYGTKVTKVEEDTVNQTNVLQSKLDNQSGGRNETLKFPNSFKIDGGTDVINVTYDWYATVSGNGNAQGTILVDDAGKQILDLTVSAGSENVQVNSVENTSIQKGKWYNISADIDFETKQILKLTAAECTAKETPVATISAIPFVSNEATGIAGYYLDGRRSANISSDIRLDNITASNATDDYFKSTITVTDKSSQSVADATVVIDGTTYTTDAQGKVTVKLSNEGSHTYTVSKDGYTSTGEADGDATVTGSITSDKADVEAKLSEVPYTPEVTAATISGGQKVIFAPTDDTPAKSAEYTIAVTDQRGNDMDTSGYTTAWAVYKTGTEETVDGVTIDGGVVSVANTFNAEEGDVTECDVVATVTDAAQNSKTAKATGKIIVANKDILVYDMDTSFTASGDKSKDYDITDVTIPEDGVHITFTYYKGKYDASASTSYGQLAFKNESDTVFYLKDTNADQLVLYTDDSHSVKLGATERDTPYSIDITIIGTMLVASFNGGDNVTVDFPAKPTKITGITASTSQTGGSGTGATKLTISSKVTLDSNGVNIIGDDKVAKVSGKTVTRTYEAKPYVATADETFTWAIEGGAPAGVSIAADTGVLSIQDTAVAGDVTISATSSAGEGAKKGTFKVTIADFQALTLTIDGPKAYQNDTTQTGEYVVLSAIDTCGDDLVANGTLPDVTWTSSEEAVATIAEGGKLTVAGKGTTDITASVNTGAETPSTAKIEGVTVDNFYIIQNVAADTTTMDIDLTDIVKTDKYLVTTSKDGKLVKQEEVDNPVKPTTKPEATVTPDVTPTPVVTDTPDVTPIPPAPATKTVAKEAGIKITATYDNGVLKTVSHSDVAEGADIDLTPADENTKVFFWQSFDSMKPAEVETVPVEESAEVALTEESEEVEAAAKITVDVTGADKVEVDPIFSAPTADIKAANERYTFNVPVGTYNIKVKMTGQRADVYANEQLLINNMLQYGSTPDTDEAHDIYIKEGYATINTRDYSSGKSAADSPMSLIEIVKAPSIVTRTPKVYVIGDSLVAKYYNADKSYGLLEGEDEAAQKTRFGNMTGWGQVLYHYLTDDVEVIDLANSGADSLGLNTTAITQVVESAKEGDIMILESGYNDKGHNVGADNMKNAVTEMYNKATAKGAKVILVSPNASAHDYTNSVAWTSDMTAVATTLNANYINLSALSYDFLYTTCGYGAAYTSTEALSHFYNVYGGSENGLHSTFYNANACAAIVAGAMSKMDDPAISGIVNKDATFTFTDPNGATVKLQPDAITFTAAE